MGPLGGRDRPPREGRLLQLMRDGVDEGGEVDEVGNRRGAPARRRGRSPRGPSGGVAAQLRGAVVQHGRAADGVEGDGEDGVVERDGPLVGVQGPHGHRLQAGELGRCRPADGRHRDVGETPRVGGGGRRRGAGLSQDHYLWMITHFS